MPNSSDIFFLNETENPGNDLWSVAGCSPMKIRRRPTTTQNDVFEYGRNQFKDQNSDIKMEHPDLKSPEESKPVSQQQSETATVASSNMECSQQTSSNIGCSPRGNPKRTNPIPDPISTSSMPRNPITGFGMEYQRSKLEMYDHLAVCVRDVEKSYGSNHILKKLCINVRRGSIYGLLGSSGCGKTTILSCIIGRNYIDKGEIFVLGEKKGGPLGAKVGYMPQETALVQEFTVRDSIFFFGRLYNLDDATLEQRYHDLVKLLELPSDGRYIKDCSGGTQRRISFAVALVHKPELLILDEPSVGADPILRDRIWKYLVKISEEDKTTVIITTHYIEEARQANQIGLMREGKILTEDNPEHLLNIYGCESLEDVFLILSKNQDKNELADASIRPAIEPRNSTISEIEINNSVESLDINYKSTDMLAINKKKTPNRVFAWHRFNALLDKNWKRMWRNKMASLFPIIMPGIQVLCFLVAVGREVSNIPFGFVNEETTQEFCKTFNINNSAVPEGAFDCHLNHISCRFIDYMDISLLDRRFYESKQEAMEDLRDGKIYGFMSFNKNYSKLMETRLVDGLVINSDATDEEIQVYLDMSSLHIGGTLKARIAERYHEFHKQVHKDCNFNPASAELPLRVEEYFYGDKDEEFIIFMTPGIITTMIYFMGVLITCVIILDEKCEGIWDRSIVAGVSSIELSLSHLLFQMTFMVFMTVELIVIVFFCFRQPYVGSLWLIFALIYLQGLAGIILGFWISIISSSHVTANVIVSGIFNPLVMASGVMWPAEAINKYVLYVVKYLPLTLPTSALRGIVKKGMTLLDEEIWIGFGILFLWIGICGVLNIYVVKRKR